jgi:hypothetical protein
VLGRHLHRQTLEILPRLNEGVDDRHQQRFVAGHGSALPRFSKVNTQTQNSKLKRKYHNITGMVARDGKLAPSSASPFLSFAF